ncbi:hypothetical protein E2C01_049537 [Portunus trituberculatus]|uniref:Uncharacterized protein n=1 Tax=Portunus trituberculatus TaxID=210409 RepID=A0A5B7GDZ7_PORTR|nr:hypothetical protein [Portunus trituberculatus]
MFEHRDELSELGPACRHRYESRNCLLLTFRFHFRLYRASCSAVS